MKERKEKKPKKPLLKRWWFWLIVAIIASFIFLPGNSTGRKSQTTTPTEAPTPTTTDALKPTPTPDSTPEPPPKPTPEPVRNKDWLRGLTPEDLKTNTGEILDVTYNGTDLIVKQKINSQSSNKLTIDQNYYNACEIIRSLGGAEIRDLQYWAVADMRDGSESKVISFTVPADTVKTIQTQQFPDNTLGNYVTDLWILPSLKG